MDRRAITLCRIGVYGLSGSAIPDLRPPNLANLTERGTVFDKNIGIAASAIRVAHMKARHGVSAQLMLEIIHHTHTPQ
jgi:hypothetical protein